MNLVLKLKKLIKLMAERKLNELRSNLVYFFLNI